MESEESRMSRVEIPRRAKSRTDKDCRGTDDIPINIKFLGFCLGKNGTGSYIRVNKSSLRKAKAKLKLLTKRNRGHNAHAVMQEVKVFIRGWLGYYYVADMKRILQGWNEWLRRRFRMYI